MTRDVRVADNKRQVMQGNLAADNMTRGGEWRTCNNAEGGDNNDDEDNENESSRWQQGCNDDDTCESFMYSNDNTQQAQRRQ
jgi:hypothetical protein